MEHKKAQVAMEFIIITGAVFFFVSIFFLAVQENMREKIEAKQNILVKEIALIVQDEINLALESGDGYSRNFKIPGKAGNLEYEINITSGVVFIKTKDDKYALALPVPEITGNINISNNKIEKINGAIYLNQ